MLQATPHERQRAKAAVAPPHYAAAIICSCWHRQCDVRVELVREGGGLPVGAAGHALRGVGCVLNELLVCLSYKQNY